MPDDPKLILPPREIDWTKDDPLGRTDIGPPIPKGPPMIDLLKLGRGLAKLIRGD